MNLAFRYVGALVIVSVAATLPLRSVAATKLTLIQGVASVIDGDTLEIHGTKIRLFGIDAPESRQFCQDSKRNPYRCGQQAAMALSDFIGNRTVICTPKTTDQYRRTVATCHLPDDQTEVNEWLVREGYATAYRRYSRKYLAAETSARAQKRGIWAGTFVEPSEWRKLYLHPR